MRYSYKLIASLALSICIFPAYALTKHSHEYSTSGLADTTILIIRHAEKSAHGPGLSPEGQARADSYVRYFEHFSMDGVSVRPDTLVASADSKRSKRERLTVTPLSKAWKLSIDSRFSKRQTIELVDALRSESHGRNVLVCWHHGKIPRLIHELGGDATALIPDGRWPSTVFGWVVVLRYDHKGHLIRGASRVVHEHLMSDDR